MNEREALTAFFDEFNPERDNLNEFRERYLENFISAPVKRSFYSSVTGIIRNLILLEYIMEIPLKKGQKLSKNSRSIMLCALYDIFFNVKPHHVVNEWVELSRIKKDKGFLNFMLREILRQTDGKIENCELPKNKIREMATRYSFPIDFTVALSEEMNKSKTEELFITLNAETPSVFMENRFKKEMCPLKGKEVYPGIFEIEEHEQARKAAANGLIVIFEKTSLLPVLLLDPQKNERILDLCSAPGNKAFMIYSACGGKIDITVNEPESRRFEQLKKNIENWEIKVSGAFSVDGRTFASHMPFDAVFIDAPCSNSGVISKRPDVKYKLKAGGISKLQRLQVDLILNAERLIKKEGRIIYAVCSFLKEEIKDVIAEVENRSSLFADNANIPAQLEKFREDNYLRIIPNAEFPVGFSMAVFRRR